jgi:hypothetical protein
MGLGSVGLSAAPGRHVLRVGGVAGDLAPAASPFPSEAVAALPFAAMAQPLFRIVCAVCGRGIGSGGVVLETDRPPTRSMLIRCPYCQLGYREVQQVPTYIDRVMRQAAQRHGPPDAA